MCAERKKGTLLWEQPVWIYTMYLANGLADPLFPIQRNSFFLRRSTAYSTTVTIFVRHTYMIDSGCYEVRYITYKWKSYILSGKAADLLFPFASF
jgi:hypothetical protein